MGRFQGAVEGYSTHCECVLRVHRESLQPFSEMISQPNKQMSLITPATAYPICTIANTPRLPEHCIEWASVLEWPKVFKGQCPDVLVITAEADKQTRN